MDNSQSKVPLPSATETEQQQQQQPIFEKQTQAKTPQVSVEKEDKVNKNVDEEKIDTQSVHSESDNEGVSDVIELVDVVDKVINEAVDEFEKITSSIDADSKKLLETDIDKIDEEIIEILREKSVERDEKLKTLSDDATSKNNNDSEKTINVDTIEDDVKSETVKSETNIIEEEKLEKIIEELQDEKVEQTALDEVKESSENHTKVSEESVENNKENIEEVVQVAAEIPKETIIDEELLPKGAVESFIAQSLEQNKPPIPIQTYLWEDVKRSKEQGGYPWTHLYKRPLGEDEEPEVILTYDRSPKSGRRSQPETPKSQKKVRIQDEVETHEDESSQVPKVEEESKEEKTNQIETETPAEDSQQIAEEVESADVKKSPKSILKRSQKLLDNIKPNTSKFDSDSLKRKIKSPLQKIKKMADQQISKVKTKSSIKKIPVGKDEIVLNEKVEILRLKESPKSQHRELPAFIVKQDSDDTIDIVDLEQSPSESRKNRLIESGIVTPDEIIDLPVSTDNIPEHETDSCKKVEENISDSHEGHAHESYIHKHSQKEMSPTTVIIHKRKEHIYEEIDDFVSKIAFDTEHVDRVKCYDEHNPHDAQLTRQDNISDPMFDEFSRELNKKIRKSLSSQDDSIRHELMKRIPKIEELEKQISDEDREEKIEQSTPTVDANKNPHLLAPISSIDSTSSDEDRRAQLSIVAEESEASDSLIKKKSFDEPSVDIHDVESLKIDDSDVSTLIDDIKTDVINETDLAKVEESHQIEKVDESQEKSDESKDEVIEENVKEVREEIKEKSPQIEQIAEEKIKESPEVEEQDIREDIVLSVETPAPIKIDPKWSKMRKRTKDRRILRGECKLKYYISQCFPIINKSRSYL